MGTARGARRFCEAFRNDNIQAAVEYPFFWDTQLLTDIRHLDFGGGDQWYTWADRFRGVSLFSWAPAVGVVAGLVKVANGQTDRLARIFVAQRPLRAHWGPVSH